VKREPEVTPDQEWPVVKEEPDSYMELFSHDWPPPGQCDHWPHAKRPSPEAKVVKRDFNGWEEEEESGSDGSGSEESGME
jgi:hypothetical protein